MLDLVFMGGFTFAGMLVGMGVSKMKFDWLDTAIEFTAIAVFILTVLILSAYASGSL